MKGKAEGGGRKAERWGTKAGGGGRNGAESAEESPGWRPGEGR
jgi:hypothetical protein